MTNYPEKYCIDLHNYEKFPTQQVKVGSIGIGSNNPIRLQSMTNISAMYVENSVLQAKRIFDAGADMLRISTPRIMDVESLKNIKKILNNEGYKKPLIADIHFNPAVAEEAAKVVEKIRINPGNYIDKKKSAEISYTEKEYKFELEKIHSGLLPLIKICKKYGTAIRIGTNHGSLSDRILNRYGNTIEGLVESLIEYLEIFKSENFYNIIVSIKSSDTRTMIKACRLLNARMLETSYVFPQHLGVTESGSGDEGRLKSATGIGSLLADGIGNTIRVSLTEAPENEIIFAKNLANTFQNKEFQFQISSKLTNTYNPYINQRNSGVINIIPTSYVVIGNYNNITNECKPDLIYCDKLQDFNPDEKYILPYKSINDKKYPDNIFPLFKLNEIGPLKLRKYNYFFIEQTAFDFNKDEFRELSSKYDNNFCIIIDITTKCPIGEIRYANNVLSKINKNIPLIVKYHPDSIDTESLIAESGIFPGSVLVDGLVSGLWIFSNNKSINPIKLSFDLLQSTDLRISKAEFISCPACGRTEYDIENVSKKVKEAFSNLKGIKIAIMGCLVNGPGEMADATYGCVGASKGKVHIYKEGKIILKNITENQIVEKLKELIKCDTELDKIN